MSNINLDISITINEEVKWDKSRTIISRADVDGTIVFINDTFVEASEYNKIELIGKPHNVIWHPDMPKVIFKKLWNSLKKGENYQAIIKNITRTGYYYWVITDFEIEQNIEGKIVGHTGRGRAIPKSVEQKIAGLYKDLLQIENIKGEEASELYLQAYLNEEIKMSYDDYVVNLFEEGVFDENKLKENPKVGFIRSLFISDFS